MILRKGHPMDISAKNITDAGRAKSSCAIVPVFSRKQLSAAAKQLDSANNGIISAALAAGDLDGKPGDTLMLHAPDGKS